MILETELIGPESCTVYFVLDRLWRVPEHRGCANSTKDEQESKSFHAERLLANVDIDLGPFQRQVTECEGRRRRAESI